MGVAVLHQPRRTVLDLLLQRVLEEFLALRHEEVCDGDDY